MKFKAKFPIPTKDFQKIEWVDFIVESNVEENSTAGDEIEYKAIIPDFMFDELADSEPRFKTKYDINNRNVSGLFPKSIVRRKFQKTQTSILLSSLRDYFNELTTLLVDKHSVQTESMKKKIFISFNHSNEHTTNGLNCAYTGERINQTFRYFIGYEVMTDKFSNLLNRKVEKRYITKIGYASPMASVQLYNSHFKEREDLFLPIPNLNESVEDFEKRYSIIDWTEEREQFCERIKQTFIQVNNELAEFLKDIDSEKIDFLMSSNKLKILGQ
jgi:hypothetical protein